MLALAAATLLAGPAAAAAAGVAYNFTGMNVTYYYDNDLFANRQCSEHAGGIGWSEDVLRGSSACGPSIHQLKSNAVVALNVTWLNQFGIQARTEDLCGREVQVWRDGKQIKLKGGPFFLWEGCQACATLPRIDMSVDGYIAATGDKNCMSGTVGEFDVYVMDNFVRRASAGRLDVGTAAARAAALFAIVLLWIDG